MTRFLNGGDKVKVTIMLRGREISRPIGGVELLQRLADDVEEYGTVESKPKQEGRNIIMTLAPKGKKVHTQSEQRRRGAESRAERQARQAARLAAKQESQAQADVYKRQPLTGFAFWETNLAYEGESIYNYLQVKKMCIRDRCSSTVTWVSQCSSRRQGSLSAVMA